MTTRKPGLDKLLGRLTPIQQEVAKMQLRATSPQIDALSMKLWAAIMEILTEDHPPPSITFIALAQVISAMAVGGLTRRQQKGLGKYLGETIDLMIDARQQEEKERGQP